MNPLRHLACMARDHSHTARADLFVRLIDVPAGGSVLDLGGGDGSFSARVAALRPDLRITVADPEPTRLIAHDRYGFDEVALSDAGPLPFADGSFDVVLCNSVIEHVTTSPAADARITDAEWRTASVAQQRAFAAEIRRVGSRFFVQTPHPAFPIDVHTWLPFTGWLGHRAAQRLVNFTDRFWVKKCGVADWHLLGPQELGDLFPGANLRIERLLGMPKSIIVWS